MFILLAFEYLLKSSVNSEIAPSLSTSNEIILTLMLLPKAFFFKKKRKKEKIF